MRAADLKRAGELAAMLETVEAVRARLAADETLRLVLGSGGTASEIVLSADYQAAIRDDVKSALAARAHRLRAELAALGVRP